MIRSTNLGPAARIVLATLLGFPVIAVIAGHPTAVAASCAFYPTGPEEPQLVGVDNTRVSYDVAAHRVSVILHVAPGSDLSGGQRFYISDAARKSAVMAVEGPFSIAAAEQQLGARPSERIGQYWVLTASLATDESFAVYHDVVWPGEDFDTRQPCQAVLRRLVTEVARGEQRSSEYDELGVRPIIALAGELSVETLSKIGVHRPIVTRVQRNATESAGAVVQFRHGGFRPLSAADASTMLDTRRGFDVAISTSDAGPTTQERRFVIGRGEGDTYVVELYSWGTGDAVGTHRTMRLQMSATALGPVLTVPAGPRELVYVYLRPLTDGLVEIINTGTRSTAAPY